MLAAGRLDQRVAVKRPTYSTNGTGERVEGDPTLVGYRWAEVRPLQGTERDYAARVAADLLYQVTMRTPLDIRQTDRILWGSRTLEVDAVLDSNNGGFVTVQCKELV